MVVGLGYAYVRNTLGGGSAGWGAVFAAMFVGLALGMSVGVRFLRDFSKRRLFGLAIAAAGVPLALLGLIPNLPVVVFLVVVLGILAGMAYVTAYTVIGREVDDDTRGRTFAFLQSALRVVMFGVIALSGLLAGAITALVGRLHPFEQREDRVRHLQRGRQQRRAAAGGRRRDRARLPLLPADGRPAGHAAAG